MGKKDNNNTKTATAEFRCYMHCDACEATVADAISNFKGVEKFITDMTEHRVEVTGKIDPQKLSRKLKKKTGKRVEILSMEVAENEEEDNEPDYLGDDGVCYEWREEKDCRILTMFSDENPNACFIM